MPRNRLIYNVQDVFAGPSETAPKIFNNIHILQRLERVFAFNYSVDIPKTNIQSLGNQGSITKANLGGPNVTFDISYYINGVSNEIRMGFTPLYHVNDTTIVNKIGNETFSNLFSGMYSQGVKSDRKNFYLMLNTGTDDLHKDEDMSSFFEPSGSIDNFYSQYTTGSCVVCFVNSYLTSYRASASVGEIPSVSVEYVADAVIGYTSGSGINVPEASPTSKNISGSASRFLVPRYSGDFNSNICTAVAPGNITINLSGNKGLTNAILDLNDIKIQSFNFNVQVPRQDISFLGNYRPVAREITPPLIAEISLDVLVGDLTSGSILNMLSNGSEYGLTIFLKNTKASDSFVNVVRYDFPKAKLQSISFSNRIGSNSTATILFENEIVPSGLREGFFVSGIINHPSNDAISEFYTALIGEGVHDGKVLLTEDGQEIFIEPVLFTPDVF